jgi:hypothetical protein
MCDIIPSKLVQAAIFQLIFEEHQFEHRSISHPEAISISLLLVGGQIIGNGQ